MPQSLIAIKDGRSRVKK